MRIFSQEFLSAFISIMLQILFMSLGEMSINGQVSEPLYD